MSVWEPSSGRRGFYYRLPESMRESLVDVARLHAEEARQEGRKALVEFGEHNGSAPTVA